MTTPATVTLRATYDDTDPNDTDGGDFADHGYTDPRNPWGGFTVSVVDAPSGPPFVAWREANAESVTLPLVPAAVFVADFPGAVWDWEPDCDAEMTREGFYRRVTLHVDGEPAAVAAVFALADRLRAQGR